MNQPRQPVTLLPEQVEALSRKLAEMRHNINNDLALINAVVEVVTRKPDMAGRLMVSLSEQPVKIVEEMKRFSAEFEKSLGLPPRHAPGASSAPPPTA